MKKYKIEIKDLETEELIDSYGCNSIIAMTDTGDFNLGSVGDYTLVMRFLEYIIERYSLLILQREIEPEERALCFKDIPKYYKEKETQENIHTGIINLLNIVKKSVVERLYEDTFKPEKSKYTIKVFDDSDQVIREISSDNFGLIASYNGNLATFFDDINDDKELENRGFQLACRTVSFLAKFILAIREHLTDEEIENLMSQGDEEIYKKYSYIIETIFESVLEFYKDQKLKNRMHYNNMSIYVDEEAYQQQMMQSYMKEFYRKLGLTPPEEEKDDS